MSDGSAPPAAPKMVQGAQADESQPQPQQKRATEANSHEEASAPRPDTTMESMEDMAAAEPQRDASGDLGVAESVRPQVDLSVDDAEAASEYGHVAQDTVAQTTEAVAQGEQPAHLREFFDDIFNMVRGISNKTMLSNPCSASF